MYIIIVSIGRKYRFWVLDIMQQVKNCYFHFLQVTKFSEMFSEMENVSPLKI